MREDKVNNIMIITFGSMYEFYQYVTTKPITDTFRLAGSTSSHSPDDGSRLTASFEEACKLFKDGWKDGAEKLTNRIKVDQSLETQKAYKTKRSVQGFHPIVPLYLMGIPDSMVTKELQPMKRKVITIDKDMSYNASWNADDIIKESAKALQLINALESQGYRINLNFVIGVQAGAGINERKFILKIRLKSANEKLNVSKLSFIMLHPSMVRRMFFRFEEVYPEFTHSFTFTYGRPIDEDEERKVLQGEYLIPKRIDKDVEKVKIIKHKY